MADIIFPGQTPIDNLGSTRLPGNLDLSIWQGDAQTYIIVLSAEDGSPIDITGYTASATIRSTYTDPVKHSFDCSQSGVNQITMYMSSANCKAMTPGSYIWEFQLTQPNGDVRTYLAGDVTVYAEVDA
jgi:hypothetical protein